MNGFSVYGLIAIGCAAMVGGCASGPYDAAGYTTVEKDNRIYVFVPLSAEHQSYNRTGEMGKSVTRIAAGPGRKTVVAEELVKIDKYLSAAKEKYPTPAPAKPAGSASTAAPHPLTASTARP